MLRDQLFRLRRLSQGIARLELLASKEFQFGTTMARATYELGKALGAAFGGYCVIDNQNALHEFFYKARGSRGKQAVSWRLLALSREISLPPELVEALSNGEPMIVPSSAIKEALIPSFVTDERTFSAKDLTLLLAPIVFEREPIGFFAFASSVFSPCFEEQKSLELLSLAQRVFHIPSKFVFQRRIKKMIVSPIFAGRDTKVEPDLVFVLMPFTESWSDRIWTRLIRPVCSAVGMRAIRADDLYGRDIMEDIWASICRARIVIADITGRNANVFYELGLAHTVGKDVVLLTQAVTDIPFDLNRFRHIVYADHLDGYDVLKKQLKSTMLDILKP